MKIEIELKDGRVVEVEKNMESLLRNINNSLCYGELVHLRENLYVSGEMIVRVECKE